MRRSIYILGLSLLTLVACDEVSEGERLIYVPPVEGQRNIIIEDFTGQRCVNCPSATLEIERLQGIYGEESVIAVGIHSGPFGHRSTMTSARLSLCTETGDEYYNHWGIEAQPGALINRSGGAVYDPAQYEQQVRTELEKSTPLQLEVRLSSDNGQRTTDNGQQAADGGALTVDVTAMSSRALEGKLQVWLLEDSITDIQMMPDGSTNRAYVHNHVFRASLTDDILGDNLAVTDQQASQTSYSFPLNPAWKVEHLSVVVFYYNDRDGILQAAKTKLTSDSF